MTKILIVSKDIRTIRTLSSNLSYFGFNVQAAASSKAAFQLLEEVCFHLIMVDGDFENTNEVSFYGELKKELDRPPIIYVGENFNDLPELESMDDFVLRPFTIHELREVMNKQLERKKLLSKPMMLGELTVDVTRNLLIVKDRIVSLGKKEMEIMIMLTKKAGKIVSFNDLMTIPRMEILKKKLNRAGGEAFQIKSVKGAGYRLLWINQG